MNSLHPAILLTGGFHDFRATPAPASTKPCCEDCGSDAPHAQMVERWNETTQRWDHLMGCCGAERDELGLKPRRRL